MSNKLVAILGASFVGKSHIIHSIVNKPYEKYTAYVTIGCKISNYNYNSIDYSLYDIFPQYSFIENALSWLKNFDFYIFICDVTNLNSINTIKEYYDLLKPDKYVIFINKTDIANMKNINIFLEKLNRSFKNPLIYNTTIKNRCDLIKKFNKVLNFV